MRMPRHHRTPVRTIPAGTLATICDQNPRHPEAVYYMDLIASTPAIQMVHPVRIKVEAIQQNRECIEVLTTVGGLVEVTHELGEPLSNQKQTGVSAEGEQDVTSATDDSGSRGCC